VAQQNAAGERAPRLLEHHVCSLGRAQLGRLDAQLLAERAEPRANRQDHVPRLHLNGFAVELITQRRAHRARDRFKADHAQPTCRHGAALERRTQHGQCELRIVRVCLVVFNRAIGRLEDGAALRKLVGCYVATAWERPRVAQTLVQGEQPIDTLQRFV